MDAEGLEKVMAQAAAIASKLPNNLQEAAFNRALDEILDAHASSGRPTQRGSEGEPRAPAPRPGRRPRPAPAEGTPAPGRKRAGPRAASGRPGPKAAVAQLISAGYFRTPRLISTVQEELRHNRGHKYTVQELSPALVRSLREGRLRRERNKHGQYEYSSVQ